MSIQFPILNISLSNLSSQDLEETHIGDLWDYPGDNSIFEEYYDNQKYVDQSGHIFKIIGKRKSNRVTSRRCGDVIAASCNESPSSRLSFHSARCRIRLSLISFLRVDRV